MTQFNELEIMELAAYQCDPDCMDGDYNDLTNYNEQNDYFKDELSFEIETSFREEVSYIINIQCNY
jgi:hypothetical protein